MEAMSRLLQATPSSACQTSSAVDSFESLIHALRHPRALFADMADPELLTTTRRISRPAPPRRH